MTVLLAQGQQQSSAIAGPKRECIPWQSCLYRTTREAQFSSTVHIGLRTTDQPNMVEFIMSWEWWITYFIAGFSIILLFLFALNLFFIIRSCIETSPKEYFQDLWVRPNMMVKTAEAKDTKDMGSISQSSTASLPQWEGEQEHGDRASRYDADFDDYTSQQTIARDESSLRISNSRDSNSQRSPRRNQDNEDDGPRNSYGESSFSHSRFSEDSGTSNNEE